MSTVLEGAGTTRSAERQANSLVRAWVGRADAIESMLEHSGGVDQVGIEERVASLVRRSIKKESKLWALDLAIRMMDLTTLEGKDTEGKVRALCAKGVRPDPLDPAIPSVAAICIYPALIPVAKRALAGTGVKVASVATGFPAGQTFTDVKVLETAPLAVNDGMDARSKAVPLRFSLPLESVSPGRYDCQVTVLDPNGQKVAFWRAPIVIIK